MVLSNTFSAEKVAASITSLPNDGVMTSRKLMRQASQSQLSQVIKNEGDEYSRLVNTP
jgi:hypothetical protein